MEKEHRALTTNPKQSQLLFNRTGPWPHATEISNLYTTRPRQSLTVFAVDPDLHHTAWAVVESGYPLQLGVWDVQASKKNEEAVAQMLANMAKGFPFTPRIDNIVIEVPVIYPNGKERPNDLMRLARVAGGAGALACLSYPNAELYLATPLQWKGSVPKRIHQARICSKLGWEYKQVHTHSYPTEIPNAAVMGAEGFKSRDWKHVLDAIGLGLWGEKQ